MFVKENLNRKKILHDARKIVFHVKSLSQIILKQTDNHNLLPPQETDTIVVLCAIWYHSHNLKNVKNTHGGEHSLSFDVAL